MSTVTKISAQKAPDNRLLNRSYVVVSILFFITLWTLKILEDTHVIGFHTLPVQILVPGYVGITMLYNFLAYRLEKTHLIAAALLFALIAETVNALNMDFGLLFFAVTHTLLMIFHWKKSFKLEHRAFSAAEPHLQLRAYKRLEWISGLVMALLYGVVVVSIELNLHTHSLEYELVVPIYMLVLSLMAWRSICTWGEKQSGRIVVGSLLFYACDVFILAELTAPNFTNPPLTLLVLSWVTYLPALFFLSCIGKDIFTRGWFARHWPNF
ncbi:MAG: lysoplasmalogenase family protein [Coriobacteriales bacterium]|nr:lysoplasmalogenase family protein [Coriobacteriales bacterium]